MTDLRSVAAMSDDIRQSSIQHCSCDVGGDWWVWSTHANRNILRPCCCHCLSLFHFKPQRNGIQKASTVVQEITLPALCHWPAAVYWTTHSLIHWHVQLHKASDQLHFQWEHCTTVNSYFAISLSDFTDTKFYQKKIRYIYLIQCIMKK